MKYPKGVYEKTDFYMVDEEITNHKQKIVKTRKSHKCVDCQEEIKERAYALYETGFMDGEPVSCYTCIECCDKWLDEIEGGENE